MPRVRRIDDLSEPRDLPLGPPPPTDDDYSRFLSSLFGEEVLPDDDNDDPDFLEDLKRMMEEYSDDEFLNECPIGGDTSLDPGPLPPSIWPPLESQPPPLGRAGNDGFICLSPARCTRSRYPMEEVDLDEIEGQLYQQMEWNLDDRDFLTHDEMFDQQVVDVWPTDLEALPTSDFQWQDPVPAPTPIQLPPNFKKPMTEFDDLFPYGLLSPQTESCFLPSSTHNNNRIIEPMGILHLNTISGPRLMASNAWTPHTILALNRIINAHIQLLVQSYSACVGVPYMKRICDEMHGMLHQSYLLFQSQATGEFPFDRMLTIEVNRLLTLRNEETLRVQNSKNKASKKSRKRRRDQVVPDQPPEEVIDLTDDSNEGLIPLNKDPIDFSPMKTVLDVPLMHLLPHLWHALTMVTVKTNGAFLTHYDRQRIETLGQSNREKGLVACLSGARRIQRILKCLRVFMTCGTRFEHAGTIRKSRSWSKMELVLLSYAIRHHGMNVPIIRLHYLPSKEPGSLEIVKDKIQSLQYDMEWKKVEKILKETDCCCTTQNGMEKRVISAQDKLFAFGNDFQSLGQNGVISDIHQIPQYVLSSMEQLHSQISNSTSSLIDQSQAIVEVPNQTQRSTVDMRDGVCSVLEQLGKQISASVDTVLAMFNLIGSVNSAGPPRTTTEYHRGS